MTCFLFAFVFLFLLWRRKITQQSYSDEGLMEGVTFFTRLGQAILSAGRTFYMFQSCGHCSFTRKSMIRAVSVFHGAHALDQIHRAVSSRMRTDALFFMVYGCNVENFGGGGCSFHA